MSRDLASIGWYNSELVEVVTEEFWEAGLCLPSLQSRMKLSYLAVVRVYVGRSYSFNPLHQSSPSLPAIAILESAALFKPAISIKFWGHLPTRRLPRKQSRRCKHSVGVLLGKSPNSKTEASERVASMSKCYLVHSGRFTGAGEMGSRERNQGLHCIVMCCSEGYKAGIGYARSPLCPSLQLTQLRGSVLWHLMSPGSESRRFGTLKILRDGT